MRAAQFSEFGGPEVLNIVDIDRPSPQPGEVLVKVRAAALQPFDARARAGRMPLPPGSQLPLTTGNEFAGIIEAVGADVTGFAPGDAVAGRRTFGAAADYLVVAATDIAIKPPALRFAEAATFGGTAQTADSAIDILPLAPGTTLLIHGAAGGVGSFALQLAKLKGARVIGVAGSSHADYLRALGAIPLTPGPGLRERIEAAAPNGISAVLDCVGGEALDISIALGVNKQHIVSIGDRRWKALGVQWPQGARNGTRLAKLLKLGAEGKLKSFVRASFPLDDIVAAHRDLDTGHGRGKIAVLVG